MDGHSTKHTAAVASAGPGAVDSPSGRADATTRQPGPLPGAGLTFAAFSRANRTRSESPQGFGHALDSWSLSDWMTAVVGEIGEAANVAKKLNRVRDGITGNGDLTVAALVAMFQDEVADAFIYLDLLAQSQGFFLEDAARDKFDRTSAKIGYPSRLAPVVPPEGEPLPCRWCHRPAVVQQDGRTWNAGCPSAVLPGDGVCHRGYAAWLHPTRAAAVAAWNRRAHPAPAVDPPVTDAELAAAADHATTRTKRLERELAEARAENARLRDELQAAALWKAEADEACRERNALLAHCIVRRFGGWLALTGPGAGSWGTFPTEAAAVAAVRAGAGLTTKGGAADA